ncbi:MAG: hypothetical protein J07HQW2_03039 [Haloquadratum walsbyi J07HQW2]|uniref:Uncharacterized protein n=1 Tax=Haloquadratum walsbyi J07HQW2 TaxID=1238425 RepID=U1N149_9EURY|nr:MAG: hypothetical protein J07HQW2_03039 [Haloquadratum walsbyi J07HQW2]
MTQYQSGGMTQLWYFIRVIRMEIADVTTA